RLPAGRGGAGRVQRQVHVQSAGAARRVMPDAALPLPRQLPQLLPARRPLAIHRPPTGEGRMSTLHRPPAAPPADDFLRDVLAGLSRADKRLPCKYFYDERGSALFDQICGLDEYYLTRGAGEVLREPGGGMAAALGPGCAVVEYGSGSGVKTALLLDRLPGAVAYVPVDISAEQLARSARRLARRYPALEVVPVVADFTRPFALPALRTSPARIIVYFSRAT